MNTRNRCSLLPLLDAVRSTRPELLSAALAIALLGDLGLTQGVARKVPIPGPVRDAGVYHLATGTWTRVAQNDGILAQDALYRNDISSGYFGLLDESEVASDEGRLPGAGEVLLPGSPETGTADAYTITGFQFGYCNLATTPVTYTLTFREAYAPCNNPAAFVDAAQFVTTGLPTGGCWIVAFDISGTSLEFTLGADGGDGIWDNDNDTDDFGYALNINGGQGDGTGQLQTGPILSGRTDIPPTQGDGTVFKNPALSGTGLGSEDLFWLNSPIAADGCYFYGGCDPCANFNVTFFGSEAEDDHYAIDCATEPDDAFEDNDDCDSATPSLDNGVYSDLFVTSTDEDWYCFELEPHKTLRIDVPHKTSRGDIDIELFNSCGGALIASDLGDTDVPCIMWTNASERTVTVYLRVFIDPAGPGECNRYKLKVKRFCVECDDCLGEDAWEDNDDFLGAVPLSGVDPTEELTIQPDDEDWFRFEIGPECWFNVAIFFSHECGDVQLSLWDSSGAAPLLISNGIKDLEFVSWINDSTSPEEYRVRIWMEPGFGTCNIYDILLTEDCPTVDGPVTFCDASANSVSPSGALLTSTSGFLTAQAEFTVTDTPNHPGLLFTGPAQINSPFGCGTRCVGGSVLRHDVTHPSQNMATIEIDMSTAPANTNVQWWYRDPQSPACGGFNLSNAIGLP